MRRLIEYLPEVLRDIREYKGVFNAQESELEELATAQDDLLASQFLNDDTEWVKHQNEMTAVFEGGTGEPRYDGAGLLIEPETENLVPSPDDLTDHINKGFGLTLYKDRAVYNGSSSVVLQKSRFIADGGPLNFWMEAYGNAAFLELCIYDYAKGINIKQITFELTETPQRFETSVSSSTSGNELELRLWFYKGTTHINWMQLERASFGTSKTLGVRAAESISIPGLQYLEGAIEFKANIASHTKRQITDKFPTLLEMTRADGGTGLRLRHADNAATYELATFNDSGAMTATTFGDSLIPIGTPELKFSISLSNVTLECDGTPVAAINNPKLPKEWGRIFLLSDSEGRNQPSASVGDVKTYSINGSLLAWWPLQQHLNALRVNSLAYFIIQRWERLLNIIPNDFETLAERRYRIMIRLIEQIPHTLKNLKRQLDYICGANGYSLELFKDEYRLKVRVFLTVKQKFGEVKELLARVIPANILLDFSLLYNQHLTLAKYTHAQLSNYTHDFIRNEVLPE